MPRHELVEELHPVHKQEVHIVHRQLRAKLDDEAAPGRHRLHPRGAAARPSASIVWDLVKAERDGEILLEVSDAVRESLIETMDRRAGRRGRALDTDEIADLAPDLPQRGHRGRLPVALREEREQLRAAMSYPRTRSAR
jgi:magnesium transporter